MTTSRPNNRLQKDGGHFVSSTSEPERSRRRLRVGVNRGADFVKYLALPRKRVRTGHLTRLRSPRVRPA